LRVFRDVYLFRTERRGPPRCYGTCVVREEHDRRNTRTSECCHGQNIARSGLRRQSSGDIRARWRTRRCWSWCSTQDGMSEVD
jgi:hypothetical protein